MMLIYCSTYDQRGVFFGGQFDLDDLLDPALAQLHRHASIHPQKGMDFPKSGTSILLNVWNTIT